jgi:hypothetical protein
MSSVLTSKPVRTSIVNRAAGEAPNAWDQLPIPSHWWDPLPIQAATPAMWQTGTQEDEPVPIDEVPLSAPAAAPEPVPDQRSSLEPDVLRDVASLPLSDMMALSTRRGIPLNTRRYIG